MSVITEISPTDSTNQRVLHAAGVFAHEDAGVIGIQIAGYIGTTALGAESAGHTAESCSHGEFRRSEHGDTAGTADAAQFVPGQCIVVPQMVVVQFSVCPQCVRQGLNHGSLGIRRVTGHTALHGGHAVTYGTQLALHLPAQGGVHIGQPA